MQTCPVCNFTLTDQQQCPRCKSDLSLLKTIEAQSKKHLILALQNATNGNLKQSQHHLKAARQLKSDVFMSLFDQLLLKRQTQQPSLFFTQVSQFKKKVVQSLSTGKLDTILRIDLSTRVAKFIRIIAFSKCKIGKMK